MKILGIWHICMINNFLEIISGQLNLLVESKLYDESEAIFVGCVGNDNEIEKVEKLFLPHKKIKILSHSVDLKQYEFLTLKILREKSATEQFYGYYFHTKGVSYPGNEGGEHWRDYMNYYLITKWKDNVDKLNEGYDTCGVKFIKDGFPPHYSGNFFWFKSSYTKNLAPISKLNAKDRYSAEMWLCSNMPKVACLCDKFVDYHTKGKFDPNEPVVKPKKVVLTKEVKPEVKPEVIKASVEAKGKETPEVQVIKEIQPLFSEIVLKGYDTSLPKSKIIQRRLNSFQRTTNDLMKDFYAADRTDVDYLFERLTYALKISR